MTNARILLDHPIIAERYFFPRAEPLADPYVVQVGDIALHCYYPKANRGGPTVLHFHGNGEVVADWTRDFAPALIERGFGVFLAEYRGYGGSTGRPALASMLDDALACADATGVSPEEIIVYGRSVGSLYALHTAANRAVAGLVIESGIADLQQRLELRLSADELGCTAAELRAAVAELFDHRAKVLRFGGPMLILHASGDDLVQPEHAKMLAAWGGDRARLCIFERGDHNSIHYYNGEAILDEVERFADDCDLEL